MRSRMSSKLARRQFWFCLHRQSLQRLAVLDLKQALEVAMHTHAESDLSAAIFEQMQSQH